MSVPNDEEKKAGFVLAVTSSKGGVGKTTTALGVAGSIHHASVKAAEEGLREKPLTVCVVDLDARDGQVGFLVGQQSPNALTLFVETTRLASPVTDELVQGSLVYAENLGVHTLLAPKRARTADYLTPEFYSEVIEKLRHMFDVVIIDTSVNYLDPLLTKVALPVADATVFVTNLSVGSVYGMTRWFDEVTSSSDNSPGYPLDKIGVVVNQDAAGLGFSKEELQVAAGREAHIIASIPLDAPAVMSASSENRLEDIILKHPLISPAYFQIVQRLLPHQKLVPPVGGTSV